MTWICTSEPYLSPQQVGASDAWTQAGGSQELLNVGVKMTAPEWVAEALSLATATAVCRVRLMLVEERPFELVESWWPHAIADGTALAEPRRIRGGAVTLLAELGYRTAEAVEDVLARLAGDVEAEALGLGDERAVLELRRVSYTAGGDAFAAESMVRVANAPQRYRLRAA